MQETDWIVQIREWMYQEPTIRSWYRIWHKIKEWPTPSEEPTIWSYLLQHLLTWPVALRILPYKQEKAWSDNQEHPLFPAVSAVCINTQDLEQATRVFLSKHASSLRAIEWKTVPGKAGELNLCLSRLDGLTIEELAFTSGPCQLYRFQAFLQHPAFKTLRTFSFPHKELTSAQWLADNIPTSLTELQLDRNQLGIAELHILLSSPRLHQLNKLDLSFNNIGEENKVALPHHHNKTLKVLNISYNNIGHRELQYLHQKGHFDHLTSLNLEGNLLNNKGGEYLVHSMHLPALRHLSIGLTNIRDKECHLLATQDKWAGLESLSITPHQTAPTTPTQDKEGPSITLVPTPHPLHQDVPPGALTLKGGGTTDTGPRRNHNEDQFGINQASSIFAVSDGMGGQSPCGFTSELFVHLCTQTGPGPLPPSLQRIRGIQERYRPRIEPQHPFSQVAHAVFDTNRLLIGRAESEHAHLQGAGCTAAAIAFSGRIAYLLNVGSDRIYLWRNNQLTQLSTDDTLVEEIKQIGILSPEEIANHPHKNIITKAIGINRHLVPTHSHIGVQDGDVFLLCTDGLTRVINDEQLSRFFMNKEWAESKEEQAAGTLEVDSQELIQMAIEAGSTDNITVLLVQAKWTYK